MAAIGNTFQADILKLITQAVAIANIADNTLTSPLANLYVSLHTASPGASGNQTTNEAAYGSYARQPVVRTSSGWAITGQTISPVATITFPTAISGTETETFVGIGTLVSGTGKLLFFGPVSPNIAVTTGVTPQLTTASTINIT